ncbi:MAG: hypothetical protein JOZ73_07855, partial [Solirubrobacterales bacterium]|nr:hypothetical protein [Solirubrobacterales bacterium]
MNQHEFEQAVGRPLLSCESYREDLRDAIRSRRRWATGKIGGSERAWLIYPLVLASDADPRRIRAYELSVGFRSVRHAGIFPAEPAFQRRFADAYVGSVRHLDALGLFSDSWLQQAQIVQAYSLRVPLVRFEDQEPDRSTPNREEACWLPALRERRILLICPFADLLAQRANEETFEAVWAKTGKRWFHPADVDALELPYGYEPATQARYETALELLEEVKAEIDRRTFDVALIAAGGLGIPIASFVKERGQVGISLGGHLQVLFGVLGERWRTREWLDRYVSDAWIDMPPRYRPDPALTGEN